MLLLSLDFIKVTLISSKEYIILKIDSIVLLTTNFMKVVHVELSDKGLILGVAEIGWNHFFSHLLRIFNNDLSLSIIPTNDIVSVLYHLSKLSNELCCLILLNHKSIFKNY